MYRAPRVANRIIDQQMREIADKKHQEALRKMKPQIDTKRPPPVPRLIVYEKHQTRDRNYQMIDEAMKIRTIQEIEQQNQTLRASRTSSSRKASRPRLIDWTAELPPHPKTAVAQRRPVHVQRPSPPPQKEVEMQTEVREEDGMRVVDTTTSPVPITDAPNSNRIHTFATAPTPEQSELESDDQHF